MKSIEEKLDEIYFFIQELEIRLMRKIMEKENEKELSSAYTD